MADVPPLKMVRDSAYAAAADPAKYRVKDAALFRCGAHKDATVLCTTAGKNGRNGRTAAVGATVLWLTCPYVNNVVARLERHGGVQAAAWCFREHPAVVARHVASHAAFERRTEDLLEEDQWAFFLQNIVEPPAGIARKYGNAAVSHADDLKCLHALVAQSLGGAANPLGDAVVNYIRFCHALVERCADKEASALTARVTTSLQSEPLFETFLTQTVAVEKDRDGAHVELSVPLPKVESDVSKDAAPDTISLPFDWIGTVEGWQGLEPDLCKQCGDIVVFLEGKAPRTRRKHRVN